jgi:hypothetical protein
VSLRISIDLDGCLYHNIAFFREFTNAMRGKGHKVGILTSHKMIHEKADRALLREYGIPEIDFYIGRPVDMPHQEDGYGEWKVGQILMQGIDVHFEDGYAQKMRYVLGNEAHRVFPMLPRGKEEDHFE